MNEAHTYPIAIIAVRLGSSRLPGKAMMPILGKPMLEHMIERVSRSAFIGNRIVLATTTHRSDDPIETLASKKGIQCFRGDRDNVLGRINSAIVKYGGNPVVELLGDNPLVHSDLIDQTIDYYLASSYDYVATITNEYPKASADSKRFPIGIRVQVFSSQVLSKAKQLAFRKEHLEHSTSFIYENPELFNIGYLECKNKWEAICFPELNLAVNYRSDFDKVKRVFEDQYYNDVNFSLDAAMKSYLKLID